MAAKKKTTEEIQDQTPEARDATEAMTADSGETKQTAAEQEGAYGKAEEPEVQKTASDPEEDVADAAPEGTGPKLKASPCWLTVTGLSAGSKRRFCATWAGKTTSA